MKIIPNAQGINPNIRRISQLNAIRRNAASANSVVALRDIVAELAGAVKELQEQLNTTK